MVQYGWVCVPLPVSEQPSGPTYRVVTTACADAGTPHQATAASAAAPSTVGADRAEPERGRRRRTPGTDWWTRGMAILLGPRMGRARTSPVSSRPAPDGPPTWRNP